MAENENQPRSSEPAWLSRALSPITEVHPGEAATALRPTVRRLAPELPWELLADPRMEVRRAGYRLVNGADVVTRLRAALLLAGDAEPALAERGRADAVGLVRRSAGRSNALSRDGIATPEQEAEFLALAERVRAAVPRRARG